jgi:DNA-directed RNA polymerase specialized sigma24 family protein
MTVAQAKLRSENECRHIFEFYNEHGLAATMQKYNLTRHQVSGVRWRWKQREKKIASGVIIKSVEKLRIKAMGYAFRYGLQSHAEDFASYCVLRLYEGNNSDMRDMATDYKKATLGDLRTKKGKAKADANLNLADPDQLKETKSQIAIFELIDSVPLKGRERICFIMHTVFGLTYPEIALCFGINRSRVSQILTEASKRFVTLQKGLK